MLKNIKKKLNSRSGESIGETLVALLISSLALVMLASIITAGSSIIIKSRDKLSKYYEEEELSTNSGTVTISGGTLTTNPIDITFNKNGAFGTSSPVIFYE